MTELNLAAISQQHHLLCNQSLILLALTSNALSSHVLAGMRCSRPMTDDLC